MKKISDTIRTKLQLGAAFAGLIGVTLGASIGVTTSLDAAPASASSTVATAASVTGSPVYTIGLTAKKCTTKKVKVVHPPVYPWYKCINWTPGLPLAPQCYSTVTYKNVTTCS